MKVGPVDFLIMAVYFCFVLGIGFALKKQIRSSEDFFLSGRSIPAWITGLAFMSANLGAIEVMGMAGNGAKYGIMTAHFYWVGAVPAMLFLAIFMMPFYYGSRIKSVPEYLKLRFNEPTRTFNAISFAIMTILMSGCNMFAMALVFHLLLNWNMDASIWISAAVVLAYTALGGLTSSIYNEVLQFFLIVLGLLPLAFFAFADVGGWSGLAAKLPADYMHLWANTGTASNPMGADWISILSGLGFVLSFGYWCTDFLAIQRALAAESLPASQRTPIIAALPEIFFPALTVLPGMAALALIPHLGKIDDPTLRYDMALPLLMSKYYPSGMLGIGLTAMMASFMAGMAGNITAFNTVFTYDIYKNFFAKAKSDQHYIVVGRLATGGGIFVSVFTAYAVMHAESIMDYIQSIFSIFNAPLFATFLLGMFWKRTTPWGGFWGLAAGTAAALVHFVLTEQKLVHYVSPMAANFWQATIAWCVCFAVTILISYFTKPRLEEELDGLVWGTARSAPEAGSLHWYQKPTFAALAIMAMTLVLDLLFW